MKQIDVLVVGELNIDIILNQLTALPEVGKESLAKAMTITLGSSSAIFASNLSFLGAKVAFRGKIGKDNFGQLVLQNLEAKGVDTSMIIQSESLATGATVILNFDEDRAMVTHTGAMDDLCFADISLEILSRARHLHFSSYFIQAGLKQDIGRLFSEAKKLGLTTSFDTQWDPKEEWAIDMAGILPNVDLFLPNEIELLHLTGTKDIPAAINSIKHLSNTVIVKMGNRGSMSWHEGQLLHKESYLNDGVVDCIGAGDSFNAGFIWKFLQGEPIEQCQEFANLTGAISTTAAGGTAAFTTKQEIMKLAKEKFGYDDYNKAAEKAS